MGNVDLSAGSSSYKQIGGTLAGNLIFGAGANMLELHALAPSGISGAIIVASGGTGTLQLDAITSGTMPRTDLPAGFQTTLSVQGPFDGSNAITVIGQTPFALTRTMNS